MHVIAAKAACFKEALTEEFQEYQRRVVNNAQVLAGELMQLGYRLVSGGTDNHLMVIDLRDKQMSGKAAEAVLDRVHITVNKNMIPYDPASPAITSGIRLGTPTVTTEGMGEDEMRQVARLIHTALTHPDNDKVLKRVREQVGELTRKFPLYSDLG